MVNSAQRRLLLAPESGENGWWGTWAEIAFTVSRTNPYFTAPNDVARVESVVVCDHPINVHNQFFEYLQLGNGRLPKLCRHDCYNPLQMLTRNNVVTWNDLSGAPRIIRIYPVDMLDFVNRKVLIQGKDSVGEEVYSQSNNYRIRGIYVDVQGPFVDTTIQFNSLTGIQKDQTWGRFDFFEVDPVTLNQLPILSMEPYETTAWYRRYYLSGLPSNCCGDTSGNISVKAIVKRDLVPVQSDQDYLLIGNIEALISEMQAIRYSLMDSAEAKQQEEYHHKKAIKLLLGECQHFLGRNDVEVQINLFGTAKLERHKVGTLI